MIRNITNFLLVFAAVLAFAACTEEAEIDKILNNKTKQAVFTLASDEGDFLTRATGDEFLLSDNFEEPNHLYIFIVFNSANGQMTVAKSMTDVSWSQQIDCFRASVTFPLPDNVDLQTMTSARAYLAASKQPLVLEGASFYPEATVQPVTESAIRKLIFKAEGLNLRDVYSTPYNKREIGGEYYVTAHPNDINENVIRFGSVGKPIRLYHVASRVDLIWGDDSVFQNIDNGNPDADPEKETTQDPNDPIGQTGTVLFEEDKYLQAYSGTAILFQEYNKLKQAGAKQGDKLRFYFKDPKEGFSVDIKGGQSEQYAHISYGDLIDKSYYELEVTQAMIDYNVTYCLFQVTNTQNVPIIFQKVTLIPSSSKIAPRRAATAENDYVDHITRVKVYNAPDQGYLFQPALNVRGESYFYTSSIDLDIDYNNYEGETKEGRAHGYIIQPEGNNVMLDVYSESQFPYTVTSNKAQQQSQVFTTWYKIYFNYYGTGTPQTAN